MALSLKSLKIDDSKVKEGVWVDWEGARWLIGSAQQAAFAAEIRKLQSRSERLRTISSDEIEKKMSFLVADHLLMGWENIEDDDGLPLEYSKEAARTLVSSYPPVAQMIITVAGDDTYFRLDEENEGN